MQPRAALSVLMTLNANQHTTATRMRLANPNVRMASHAHRRNNAVVIIAATVSAALAAIAALKMPTAMTEMCARQTRARSVQTFATT